MKTPGEILRMAMRICRGAEVVGGDVHVLARELIRLREQCDRYDAACQQSAGCHPDWVTRCMALERELKSAKDLNTILTGRLEEAQRGLQVCEEKRHTAFARAETAEASYEALLKRARVAEAELLEITEACMATEAWAFDTSEIGCIRLLAQWAEDRKKGR